MAHRLNPYRVPQCAVSGSEHRFTKNLSFRVVFSYNDNSIASVLKSYNWKYHQIGGKQPGKMNYRVYKSILVSRIYKKSNFGAQLNFQKGAKNNIKHSISKNYWFHCYTKDQSLN